MPIPPVNTRSELDQQAHAALCSLQEAEQTVLRLTSRIDL